jgi:hypothetical protein
MDRVIDRDLPAEIKGQRTDHFQSHVDHSSAHGLLVVVGVHSARALVSNERRRVQGQVHKVVAPAPGRACQVCHRLPTPQTRYWLLSFHVIPDISRPFTSGTPP